MSKKDNKSFRIRNAELNNPKKYKLERTNLKFYWSLKYLCIDECEPLLLKDFLEAIEKLQLCESLTWGDMIQVYGGKTEGNNHHFFSIEELPKDKRLYLSAKFQEHDQAFSFRMDGKKRLIGVKDRAVFYVLWYDPEHEILKSEKRYT